MRAPANRSCRPERRTATPSGPNIAAKLDAADILASVGAALYHWDIESDALVWSSNVLDVLRVTDIATISTGRRYAQLLDAGNVQARFDAVMQTDQRDEGCGVFFQTDYCIRPDSGAGAKLRIEDSGRWFAGPSGRPARAHGTVRVVTERHESDSRLSYLAYHDSLTGELNRHQLTVILEKTLEEAMRSRSSCGFLLVAIDNLGRINDSYGFDIADEVIGVVAKRIRGRMRGKDSLAAIPAPSSASCSPNARRTTWRSPLIACLPESATRWCRPPPVRSPSP